MKDETPPTAEEASNTELLWASVRLLLSMAVLALLVVPILRDLPLGQTTRTGLLAWVLVAVALYWLFAGLGYRSILLVQLVIFSVAAMALSAKVLIVAIGIDRLSILRRTARARILVGAGCAGLNLGLMLLALARRWRAANPPGS
jgi:hypothetical protein